MESNSYETEIDNIISQYRTQLDKIKSKSSIARKENEDIKPISNKELTIEIQNDNMKLVKELTSAKTTIKNLNTTITEQKKLIEDLNIKVTSLKNDITLKEKENENKINEIIKQKQTELDNITIQNSNALSEQSEQNNLLNSKIEQSTQIINKYVDFYNSNIHLFNKAQMFTGIAQLRYNANDPLSCDKSLCILQDFISKLLNDNTEMHSQLVNYEAMLENANQISSINENNIKDVKYENALLKQQINYLIEKINSIDKENDKLTNESRQLRSAKSFKGKIKKRSTSMLNNINYFDNNDNEANTAEPIRRLKLKIKNLEEKIKGNEVNNE